jgi:very-short-patch-repair endonuclease
MADQDSNKKLARALRKRMTATEVVVWNRLKGSQLGYKFRRQHPIAGYVLDFYCHRSRLCVEIDGEGHERYHLARDAERDAFLEELGIHTIRFRNHEIALNWSVCSAEILKECIDRDSNNNSPESFE